MRSAAALVLLVYPALAQFKTTVPLVVAPTSVTDTKGRFIDGLTDKDLIVYDNNVPQAIQVETFTNPISLVVVIEANTSSAAILDKLGRSGNLFTDLLAGDAGETALVAFSHSAKVIQDFTVDSRPFTRALRALRSQGDGCSLLDGILEALHMLATRDAGRRRVILVIAESRDRSSKVKLPDLMRENQLQNTAIYWLTYSTFLAPFSNRPKRVWDRMTDEEKNDPRRMQPGIKYPRKEEEAPLPPDMAPDSLLNVFTELFHKTAPDAATLLSTTTGGRTLSFVKQSGLEGAIQAVGAEVHRQYIVTFQPKLDEPGAYHTLRAEVKGKPELQVRTRAGYWRVQ